MAGPSGNEARTQGQRPRHLEMWFFRTSQGSLWHSLHSGRWLGQPQVKLHKETQVCVCKEAQCRGSGEAADPQGETASALDDVASILNKVGSMENGV